MTPNFDEGTDKTHSIGVPDFVGGEMSEEELEKNIVCSCGGDTHCVDTEKLLYKCESCVTTFTDADRLIAIVRAETLAECARQLREKFDQYSEDREFWNFEIMELAGTWEGK
jgi:hypothetical protein